jgi:hypothetical protein
MDVFGNLVLLKRWHWLVVATLMGLAAGYAFKPTSLDLRDYGERLNGPRDYEWNLIRETKGRRRFMELEVHRQEVTNPAGGSRDAWIVSGLYCGNAPEPQDGAWHWRPKYIVADEPYKPAVPLSLLAGDKGAQRVASFGKLTHPTVLDFLDVLRDTRGVQFRNAWWLTYVKSASFAASLLLLGLIFPTAIDLIVYGRLIRPREPKGIKLTPLNATTPLPVPQVTADDMKQLEALDATMEDNLAATAAAAASAAASPTPAPIAKLNNAPQPIAAPFAKADPRTFGAKPDDFYPTERKTTERRSKAPPKDS